MRSIKRRIENFQFYNPGGIEQHLENMAAKGWMLDEIGSIFWVYKRIEPTILRFNIAYFNGASDYDPSPSNDQWNFYDYCREAGWNFVTSQNVMQVFYTSDPDVTPIETDPHTSLQTIHNAFKKKGLSIHLVLILYSLFQLYTLYSTVSRNLAINLANFGILLSILIFIELPVIALLKIIGYSYWYYKAKKSVRRQNTYTDNPRLFSLLRHLEQVFYGIFVVVAVCFALTSTYGFLLPLVLIIIFIIYSIAIRIRNILKEASVSKRTNQIATAVITMLLSFICIPIIIVLFDSTIDSKHTRIEYTYTAPNGSETNYDVYHDTLPLEIDDIYDHSQTMYSKEYRRFHSVFSTYIEGRQNAIPFDSDGPELTYHVSIIHVPILVEPVLNGSISQYSRYIPHEDLLNSGLSFVPIDSSSWDADDAFQSKQNSGYSNHYILRWGNRIATIRTSFPINDSMKIIIQKKLRDLS